MDKSNHRITVDREYLEELEKFKEKNQTEYNAKASLKNVGRGFESRYALFVEVSEGELSNLSSVADGVVIVDNEGRELGQFIKRSF